MKVIVTGATGFIGSEIISELAENNFRVVALGRSGKSVDIQSPDIEWFQKDIAGVVDWTDLEQMPDVEAIIHSAGLAHQFGTTTKEEFDAVNVKGTENVLNLAVKLKIKHFILIGSTAVYDAQKSQGESHSKRSVIEEDAPLAPPTLYAASKLAGEQICRQICEAENIALTIFRLAPVIGEDNAGNVARLIKAIDKNRFLWIGDGQNLKSLIYKRDVARACVKLLEMKKTRTEIFNLAAEPVQMIDFVERIAARLNRKIFPARIPAAVPRTFFRLNRRLFNVKKINKVAETVEKWLADDVYSTTRIARAYDFRPSTTIEEAIDRQVDQYTMKRDKAV